MHMQMKTEISSAISCAAQRTPACVAQHSALVVIGREPNRQPHIPRQQCAPTATTLSEARTSETGRAVIPQTDDLHEVASAVDLCRCGKLIGCRMSIFTFYILIKYYSLYN